MWAYVRRRLLLSLMTYWAVASLVFGLLYLTGDPVSVLLAGTPASRTDVAQLRRDLGLDQPVAVQYGRFLAGVVQGDVGRSMRSGQPAMQVVLQRVAFTAQLAVVAITIALGVAVPLGVLAAMFRGSLLDRTLMLLTMLAQSMPIFWVGLLMILVFAVSLQWLPAGGAAGIRYVILPAITLALYPLARVARLVRSSLVDVLHQDYVRAARARGVPELAVVARHTLRNAALPVITVAALQFGHMLGGAVITETIFGWPGIGHYTVIAIQQRDFPVVQAAVLLSSGVFIALNLAVDLLYGYLDPRIRYS
jgi:ABC-type dipeptide/oligopeptide/nickel transport system permease component